MDCITKKIRSSLLGVLTPTFILLVGFLFIPNSVQAQSAETVFKNTAPGVVTVVNFGPGGDRQGRGAGFFVNENGILVTANHVVEDAHSLRVIDLENREYDNVNLWYSSPENDLAILGVGKSQSTPPLRLGSMSQVPPGSVAYAIGHPLGLSYSITDGVVSGLLRTGENDDVTGVQFSVPVSPGNSGGPLLNQQGEVIGVVSAAAQVGQNVNFATSINLVHQQLRSGLLEGVPERDFPEAGDFNFWGYLLSSIGWWFQLAWTWISSLGIFGWGLGFFLLAMIWLLITSLYDSIKTLFSNISRPIRQGKVKDGFSLTRDQIDYIRKPSFSLFGPFNLLARGLWGIIIFYYLFDWVGGAALTAVEGGSSMINMMVALGIFGLWSYSLYYFWRHSRRWAWNTNKWENFEDFKSSEKIWKPWGIVVFAILLVSLVYSFFQPFM